MPVDVEVVFDFSSPFSWLACMRIEDVTAKYGDNVNIIWKPCRVMDIWMITQPNAMNHHKPEEEARRSKFRDDYYIRDLNEWYEAYGLKPKAASETPHTPVEPTISMQEKMKRYGNACTGFVMFQHICSKKLNLSQSEQAKYESKYVHAVYKAYREEGFTDIHNPVFVATTIQDILKELLVDDKNIPNDDEVLSFINNKENKNIIINWGKDAAKRGSFGVPTMFVATDHMYFGNDRMPLLQRRLDIETGMLSKDDQGMTMWSKM